MMEDLPQIRRVELKGTGKSGNNTITSMYTNGPAEGDIVSFIGLEVFPGSEAIVVNIYCNTDNDNRQFLWKTIHWDEVASITYERGVQV